MELTNLLLLFVVNSVVSLNVAAKKSENYCDSKTPKISEKVSEDSQKLRDWLSQLSGTKAHCTADNNQNVQYFIGICTKPEVAKILSITDPFTGILEVPKNSVPRVVGRWNNSQITDAGDKWMTVILGGGDGVKSCENNESKSSPRQGVLLIVCDTHIDEPVLHLATSVSAQKYVFTLKVKTGCSAPSGFSIGTFFFILFLLFVTYFVCGFVYRRFVLGARGYEQIPNYLFWRHLVRVIQDKMSVVTGGEGGQGGRTAYREYRDANDDFRYDNPPLTVDSSVEEPDGTLGSDQYRPIPQQLRNPNQQLNPGRIGQEDDSDERLLQV